MNEEVQNLNTSHVKVQLLFNLMKKILLPNLNTSHVKVQLLFFIETTYILSI